MKRVSGLDVHKDSVYMCILQENGEKIELKLVNPYFIKLLPGRKSDVKDAEWIATVLQNWGFWR